ncbi:MAG: EF-P lysine aminoacylase EpmA [Gammaproteobacteria bacterium]
MTQTAGLPAEWRPGCSLEVLRKRAWMLATIRSYFKGQGVLEVETPSLCHTVGTDPYLDYFRTSLAFHGAQNDRTLFLQTSPEFSMKRLLASGSGSIYQICKAYRNGESGRLHNPEFTILEWYRVGFDLDRLMDDIDALLTHALGLVGANHSSERVSYREIFMRHCGLDPLLASVADFRDFAQGVEDYRAAALCGDEIRLWQEYLFACRVQPQLGKKGLCFVYEYPATQSALARLKPGDARIVERVEVFSHGVELANGFHELGCSNEQRTRFQQDLEIRRRSDKDLPAIDERLLQALTAGFPDCSGVALGLDRVLMLLTGASSIDEVMSFSLARA